MIHSDHRRCSGFSRLRRNLSRRGLVGVMRGTLYLDSYSRLRSVQNLYSFKIHVILATASASTCLLLYNTQHKVFQHRVENGGSCYFSLGF